VSTILSKGLIVMEKNEDAHALSLTMLDDVAKAYKEGKLKSCEMVVGNPEVCHDHKHPGHADKVTYTFVVDNTNN